MWQLVSPEGVLFFVRDQARLEALNTSHIHAKFFDLLHLVDPIGHPGNTDDPLEVKGWRPFHKVQWLKSAAGRMIYTYGKDHDFFYNLMLLKAEDTPFTWTCFRQLLAGSLKTKVAGTKVNSNSYTKYKWAVLRDNDSIAPLDAEMRACFVSNPPGPSLMLRQHASERMAERIPWQTCVTYERS